MNAARTLILRLAGSWTLASVLLALHLSAALSVWLVLPGYWDVAGAVLVVVLGIIGVRERALLAGGRSAHTLTLVSDGSGMLTHADGTESRIPAGARRYVTRFWVSLPLASGRRRSLLVTSGMMEPSAFRALRLWALWNHVGVAPMQPADPQ